MTTDDFKFVDAHVHFYDMKHPKLHYAHWQPDSQHPVVGTQLRKLGLRNYLAEDFILDSKPLGMQKAIHVQAAIGSKDPVEETKWLQECYERVGIPNAIVGYVDLRAPDAREVIERHAKYENFKGIRDFSYGNYLMNEDFRKGFSLLQEYNLVSSIAVEWQDIENLADLANTYPKITIVIDHAGSPTKRSKEYFEKWREGMKKISSVPNIVCKISGLGMGDNNWNVETIRPYVETCIELFGVHRSLFATNWPVDSLWSEYKDVIYAYREITKDYTKSEKELLFYKNAELIYGI